MLMAIWNVVKLGEIASITSSKRIFAKEYQTEGIPFYRGKEIIEKHNGNDVSTELYISRERYEDIRAKFDVPKPKDILLTSVGTLGVPWLVDEGEFYFKDGNLTWIRCNEKTIPEFLYLWFNSSEAQNQIMTMCIGSTQKALTIEILNKFDVTLPSLEIQKKICTIINPISNKIKTNTMINRNLLEQAETLFQSWFVDYEHFGGCCPEDWTEGVLEDVVDFFNGYAFKGSELLDAPDPNNECYHVFKQGHINRGGGFNISGTKSWFPKKDSEKLSRYVLRKGDILMAMTDMKNNVAILGNTAVMEMDDTYILNQRVALLRANGTFGIEYPFVYLLTNSIDFISDLRSRANSGVQVNLSATEIKNSKLMIPSTEVNKEFNSLVHPLFEAMIEHDLENLRLGELRDALLPKLMSGELDLSDVDL